MSEIKQTKPMNADIAKALKALKPLGENEELPSHYRHKVAVLCRGLELLGTELGRREAGAAQAKGRVAESEYQEVQPEAEHGNQGA